MSYSDGVKPDAQEWSIKEQIVEDLVTGITIQFERVDDSSCPFRLRLFGDFPFGNRELCFSPEGIKSASGTYVGNGGCKPTWLTDIDKL